MRTKPTTDETIYYHEHGYLVVPEFLEPEELETWRKVVDLAVESRGEPTAFLRYRTWLTVPKLRRGARKIRSTTTGSSPSA